MNFALSCIRVLLVGITMPMRLKKHLNAFFLDITKLLDRYPLGAYVINSTIYVPMKYHVEV